MKVWHLSWRSQPPAVPQARRAGLVPLISMHVESCGGKWGKAGRCVHDEGTPAGLQPGAKNELPHLPIRTDGLEDGPGKEVLSESEPMKGP